MIEKSSVFMNFGTTLGGLVSFIIALWFLVFQRTFINYIPFIFIGFTIVFRIVGYGFDRFMDYSNKRKS